MPYAICPSPFYHLCPILLSVQQESHSVTLPSDHHASTTCLPHGQLCIPSYLISQWSYSLATYDMTSSHQPSHDLSISWQYLHCTPCYSLFFLPCPYAFHLSLFSRHVLPSLYGRRVSFPLCHTYVIAMSSHSLHLPIPFLLSLVGLLIRSLSTLEHSLQLSNQVARQYIRPQTSL